MLYVKSQYESLPLCPLPTTAVYECSNAHPKTYMANQLIQFTDVDREYEHIKFLANGTIQIKTTCAVLMFVNVFGTILDYGSSSATVSLVEADTKLIICGCVNTNAYQSSAYQFTGAALLQKDSMIGVVCDKSIEIGQFTNLRNSIKLLVL